MTSHAYIFEKPAEVTAALQWKEVPKPRVQKSTEVLVRVKASSVNFSDVYFVEGIYLKDELHLPSGAGYEAVGVVEEIGSEVTDLKVGQRVHFVRMGQAWTEYGVFDTKAVVMYTPVPDYVSDEAAAQLSINPLTVLGIFTYFNHRIQPGEFLLHNAASSALGRIIIQVAKAKGLRTINIVRRDSHIEDLKSIGGDYVINSEKEDVAARVNEITQGKGATYVFDAVNGKSGSTLVDSLAHHGALFIYGLLSHESLTVDVAKFVFKHATIQGFYLVNWTQEVDSQKVKQCYQELFSFFAAKKLHLTAKTFDGKTQFKEAVAHWREPGKSEKTVLLF